MEALPVRAILETFERKTDELKRLARDIVKPLTRNFLELELKASAEPAAGPAGARDGTLVGRLPYLTCTRVEEADLPWK